jgi:predicted PurR-regulated permease PerM
MEATTTATTPVVPGSSTPARSDWRRAWVVVGVLLIVASGAFVLTRGATMVYYLVLSWFLALAMEPAVGRLTRWMPRALATTTVLVALVLGFIGFFWAFGSLLVDQLSQLVAAVPGMADSVLAKLNDLTGSQYTVDQLVESAGISPGDLTSYAQDVAVGVIGFVAAVLSTTFGLFAVGFFVFYLSVGMPALRGWLAHRVNPRLQVPFLAAWDLTRIKVGGYIAARVVLASINSVCSGIVFYVIGLPYWLPLALWTGIVAQFVPNVGTYISIALPTIVGLTSGDPVLGLWVLLWGILYQQVENLTFEPRISARAVDVHPAVSFGSAILGAQLFGLAGALLAVPLAATAMAMLEIYQRRYELTAQTEERVAALVAPSADRSWRDRDDAGGDDPPPTPDAVTSAAPPDQVADPPPHDEHPDGKEPA